MFLYPVLPVDLPILVFPHLVDLEPFALSTMLAMPFVTVNLASFLNLIPSLDVDLNAPLIENVDLDKSV